MFSKEDLFEAIIGAVALDSNWDFEQIQEVVEDMLNPDSILATGTEILTRRDYIAMPEYEYCEEHDGDGNPIWFVTCKVEGFDFTASIDSSSKKQAKKQVAFDMLNYILENYEKEHRR